jgi:thiol-disulfide isomerase/thioredoxin
MVFVDEPGRAARGTGRGRAVLHLTLVGLVALVLVASAVTSVQRRLERSPPRGLLAAADQPAGEVPVEHRVTVVSGALLGDGGAWSSTGVRGSVLVVNFWASWCPPCREEQPELNKVVAAYRGRGVALVGVNVNDEPGAARAYTREFAIPYPSLVDPRGELAARLGVPGLPITIVLDRDGVAAYKLLGKTNQASLSARLELLLARGGRWSA